MGADIIDPKPFHKFCMIIAGIHGTKRDIRNLDAKFDVLGAKVEAMDVRLKFVEPHSAKSDDRSSRILPSESPRVIGQDTNAVGQTHETENVIVAMDLINSAFSRSPVAGENAVSHNDENRHEIPGLSLG